MGRKLGDPHDPLLVSVRSGAKFSMPGMMDTVLNLGLNDKSVEGPRRGRPATSASPTTPTAASSRCTAASCSASTATRFEHPLEAAKDAAGVTTDAELTGRRAARSCATQYKAVVKKATGKPFPQDPTEQLRGAVEAVFQQLERRPRHRLPRPRADQPRPRHRRQRAGDGVRQPRRQLRHRRRLHPQRGHRRERAVRRLPRQRPGRGRRRRHPQHRGPRRACGTHFPEIHDELLDDLRPARARTTGTCATPSSPSSRASSGCCRPASASAPAPPRCKMAVDMTKGTGKGAAAVEDHARGGAHARHRRPPRPGAAPAVRRQGRGVSPRASAPRRAPRSARCTSPPTTPSTPHERGEEVILVRNETSPEDVHGMMVAEGILTARGGLVSHAAVVARGWGTPAVVGAEAVKIDGEQFTVGDVTVVNEGDVISLDGTTGEVVLGEMALAARRAAGRVRRRSSSGPTRSARASSACAPTPTPARTPPTPASSAPRASACAAPSTCSSRPTACPSCAR